MKHKKYLGMLTWGIPANPSSMPVCAVTCKLKTGVLYDQGNMISSPGQIVDDTILAAIKRPAIEAVLVSIIEAIFVVIFDNTNSPLISGTI